VDGPVHDEQPERDQRRTAWLAKEGIRVLRFSAEDIQVRSAAVLAAIDSAAREARSAPSVGAPPTHRLTAVPPPPQAGEGFPTASTGWAVGATSPVYGGGGPADRLVEGGAPRTGLA
jgi:hypothetical protein